MATVGGVILSCSTPALAHGDGRHAAHSSWGLPAWGPLALFAGGVVVLAASVFLDARDAVARRYADGGVLLGLLAVVTSIPLYWL